MRGVEVPGSPVLVPAGLPLDWLEYAFVRLAWHVDAHELAPGVPPEAMTPRRLRNWLLSAGTSYQTRDTSWAAIVTACRRPGSTGSAYRLAALGLALAGLRGFRRRIHLRAADDLADMHADLVCGFLTRLATIDVTKRNVAGRLIDSAIGYARRRYHQDHPPAGYPRARSIDPGSAEVHLYQLAARLAEGGQPVDPRDLQLIAMTRLDRHTVIQAAHRLQLPVETAYKRRQRAEARLATATGTATRRTPTPRSPPPAATPVNPAGASPAAAPAAPPSRRKAANPAKG